MSSMNTPPTTAVAINIIPISREVAHPLLDGAFPDAEFWCCELDGTYTVRTKETITLALRPGEWKYAVAGYPYWVRHVNPEAEVKTAQRTSL